MPESLPDAFDAPISAAAGGKSYELPLLDLDDLSALGRAIYQEIKVKKIKQLPLTAPPEARDNIVRYYDDQEADVDTLAKYVFTLPGTLAVIRRSLGKLKVSAADADAWAKRHARENGWQMGTSILAARLSGLFPPKKEAPAGNPPTGEAAAETPAGETGSSADVSSSGPAASQQAA